ncbi:MAG: LptF/LptG family permease [Alphaproteobacteria bacterium]|nr:LptF/LptG family permease [Alphaproteobacteria bacterium]MBU1281086.1 LptF/LptG family permease [Alphaproteobacteria bacterium]MBU1571757.1 LptF/LptG family permease [Alphaproteobacteria bacterium]MBU1828312.1 LptF/LptG family permease [Alphaproteobacteria bacterium]MBU2078514.1 LptF/LptG family permease [Alphaproteobacteria bacterium]
MGRFDKYMLQQLLMLFGFFSLVLALVFWVNKAVSLLDWLMGDGQSASVFLQLTLLSLPTILVNLLPIAAFAATVYVTNRLSAESELVVVQAAGYSPYRLARPVFFFSVIVALMVAILAHVLVPLSVQELDMRRSEIARDVTARLLTEGTFVHPTKGITFYVRNISAAGELEDIYLSNSRDASQRQSFMASRALIVKGDGRDGSTENDAPMLLMFDGMAQTYEFSGKRLSVTRFDSFAYGLGGLINTDVAGTRSIRATTTFDLLRANPALQADTGVTKDGMIAEANMRMNKALQSVAISLIGFGTLIVGGFSRFGLWRQILVAIVLLVVVKSIDNTLEGMIDNDARLWPFRYFATVLGLGISWALLWKAAHPRLRRAPRLGSAS